MGAVPHSAIVFVNNDLSESAETHLVRLLHISDVVTGEEFDGYVEADSTYLDTLRMMGMRVMVVRTFLDRADVSTWTLADVVIFVKNGLAAVECNKFGPPGLTLPVINLYWGALGIFE